MKNFLSVCLISVFFILGLEAQNAFHRLYDPVDREHIAMGVAVYSGGYYVLNAAVEDGVTLAASVTKLDLKGSEVWTYDYTFGEEATYVFTGDIAVVAGDTVVITIPFSNDVGNLNNKLIARINPDGELAWSKAVGGYDSVADIDTINAQVISRFDSTATMFSTYFGLTDLGLESVNFDSEGGVNWSTRHISLDEGGFPQIISANEVENYDADSSFVVVGNSISNAGVFGAGVTKIDSLGQGEWTKILSDAGGTFLLGNAIAYFSGDTTMAIGGIQQDLLTGQLMGHVSYTDSLANPRWSRTIDFGQFANTLVNGIAETEDNGLIVSGEAVDFILGELTLFLIKFDKEGNVLWQRSYPRALPVFSVISDLIELPENLIGYYGTSLQQNLTDLGTNMLVVDSIGAAICEDTIDMQIVFENDVLVDSLGITTVSDTAVVDIPGEHMRYDTIFNLSLFVLSDTTYCPMDPIMYLIDAERDGTVAYDWNTGDTTSSIIAMSEGEYIATVTYDHEKGCYLLCDTSIVATYDTLMLNTSIDWSPWCEDRTVNISANISAAQSRPPFTYLWDTGEMTPIISVTPTASGTVSVTDGCGIVVSSDYEVPIEDAPQPDVITPIFDAQRFCDTGEYLISLTSMPQSNVDGLTNIIWTDENGNEIGNTPQLMAPGFGTYCFTATDNCMYELEETCITISENDLPEEGEISLSFNVQRYCLEDIIELTASTSGSNVTDFVWGTGETQTTIIVEDLNQTYSASAMDCGREISANITPANLLPALGSINISENQDLLCELQTIQLTAAVTGDFVTDFSWNTGEVETQISVTEFGVIYSATADHCGRPLSDSLLVEVNVDEQVRWPNVFYPNNSSADSLDMDFGPYIVCPEAVTDYELRVYNRWGQLMFETTDPTMDWDGTNNGNRMPSDAYVFYSKYAISGAEEEVNGTVNLVR